MNKSVQDEPILNQMLQAFSGSKDTIFAINEFQKILLWTDGMQQLFGVAPKEAIGKFCYEIIRGTDAFGNTYCCNSCPIMQTIARNESVHPFDLYVPVENRVGRKKIHCSHALLVNQKDNSRICIYQLRDPEAVVQTIPKPLTKREFEVLQCLAKGMDSAMIAAELQIHDTTVRNHIQSILSKFGVHSRVEAVVSAYKQKWVS